MTPYTPYPYMPELLPPLSAPDRAYLEAAKESTVDAVLAQLDLGAHLNVRAPFNGNSALMNALSNFKHGPEIVHALLDKGIDFNAPSFEMMPIQLMAQKKFIDALDRILRLGADPNAELSKPSPRALHFAAQDGGALVVQRLLTAGAEVNHQDELGRTALHYVSTAEAAVALIDAGAEVDALDKEGNTPLLMAILAHYPPSLVAQIVAHGADIERDTNGLRPLHTAVIKKRPTAFAQLLAAGADPDSKTAALQTVDHLIADTENPGDFLPALTAHRARSVMRNAAGRRPHR